MSRIVRRRWGSDLGAPSREARRSCAYEAYVPDLLRGRSILLDGEVAAAVSEAEAAIARFDVEANAQRDTEALARMLLRAESIASSKIEGLEVGVRRLLRAEAARSLGGERVDVTASEVLANIDAMVYAVSNVDTGHTITIDLILEIHRRLFAGSRLAEHGGRIRKAQNWIGGNDYNPCSAAFVPPPPEFVEELLEDLVGFCNDDGLPPVAQAAIAHAQFETIHPFIDGNGRTGRALIHLVLRKRGLCQRILPPVSLILATWAKDYVGGLNATRYRGPATSSAARNGTNLWIERFASACLRAVEDATSFERRAQSIEANWRQQLGRVRTDSATDRLLRRLIGAPVLTTRSASELIGRSFVQTNEAVARLVDAGILHQVTVGSRNRAFEVPEIIAAFTDLERQLASPAGDTRASAPVRRVPRAKR